MPCPNCTEENLYHSKLGLCYNCGLGFGEGVTHMQKIKLYQSEDRRHRALAEINTDGQGTLVFQRQPEGSKRWEEIFRDKKPMGKDELNAIIMRNNTLCQV